MDKLIDATLVVVFLLLLALHTLADCGDTTLRDLIGFFPAALLLLTSFLALPPLRLLAIFILQGLAFEKKPISHFSDWHFGVQPAFHSFPTRVRIKVRFHFLALVVLPELILQG